MEIPKQAKDVMLNVEGERGASDTLNLNHSTFNYPSTPFCGFIMKKEKVIKPDGRYIIYYSFDEGELTGESDSETAQVAPEPECGEGQE
ncbi:MAG: hypothetical protein Q7N50_09925 [Armatimonadota bacterium]|nr:hypothetical protein [Armatimonadota bacterium]